MIDLSGSTDPEIVAAAAVLEVLDAAARAAGVSYLVVGATARNILSVALFGRLPGRATRDIDIAVAVASWDEFRGLTKDFTPRAGSHTFTVDRVEVDVVPYGGVETGDRMVLMPDEHRLNVLGFKEAYAGADQARLPGGLVVPVPTTAGLAALKLIAWGDRRLETRRDATDLSEVLDWYQEGSLLDDLYSSHVDLLAAYDFDPALAAAHRLGREMAELLGPAGRAALLRILDNDDLRARLAADMRAGSAAHRQRLVALRAGVRGEVSTP